MYWNCRARDPALPVLRRRAKGGRAAPSLKPSPQMKAPRNRAARAAAGRRLAATIVTRMGGDALRLRSERRSIAKADD